MLHNIDWRTNPQVVDALVTAAWKDVAATVRQACIHSLAIMGCNTMPVVNALQALRLDADPRVREEAEQALAALAPIQPVRVDIPASH